MHLLIIKLLTLALLVAGAPLEHFWFTHSPTASYGSGHEKDKVKTVETKILGELNGWLTTTNNYSTCGLLTSQTGNNHLPGGLNATETTTNVYDGADNLVQSTYLHRNYVGNQQSIVATHHYDHAGRSAKNYFQVGTGVNRQLNSFVYDARGNVATKYQGGTGLTPTPTA